ncbi:glycoside hydrolase [Pluteus cervinus]|uniref:Glycoside hydrolase n=1 Tax=Pluteus cervinus TaxID=181527 RepID=A0ACD3AY57_9AGAR|nr:glycoside hydrolase [Pluteus cervinus]
MVGNLLALATLGLAYGASQAQAYDNSRSDNIAVYYGQNSYGVANPNPSVWQKNLGSYCQDDVINVFPLAFLHVFFSTGGLPEINMANTCSSTASGVFPGTSLANCQFLAADIKACQARGKLVTLSLGGATGAASFSSDAQATAFADTVWNIFLGGSSSTRPFGDAVLDGVDLDIEGGGSSGFITFANRLRTLTSNKSKKYYLTAAPQCPFPDAYLGAVLNAVPFDAVYVQSTIIGADLRTSTTLMRGTSVNGSYPTLNLTRIIDLLDIRDTWAKTQSPNRDVKVFIGAPASSSAAGSGYVDAATLGSIVSQTRSQYSSFGGVMFWDASQVYGNNRIDAAVKNALGGSVTTKPLPTSTPPSTIPTTTRTTTTNPGSGSCGGVPAWNSGVAYVGGNQVSYNNHLWTAKWWTQADTPGGPAGVWTDGGVCRSKIATVASAAPTSAYAQVTSHLSEITESLVAHGAPTAVASLAKPTAADHDGLESRQAFRFFRRV